MAAVSRPRYSIIIPSYNGAGMLRSCLQSLEAMLDPSGGQEWIVVDNGSSDETQAMLHRRFPRVKVVSLPCNKGFAAAVTAGVCRAEGDYVVFLNNDMRVDPEWLAALDEALGQSAAACATGKILDRTGRRIDFVEGLLLFDGHALQRYQGAEAQKFSSWKGWRPTFIACGGNMAVRRDLYLSLGGFDEDFFAYTEDVDFSWRLWAAGHEIVFVPEAVTYHEHQATSSRYGPYRRGFLYERNAFWCLYKNIEAGFFHRMVHLAWMTLLHRTRWIAALHEPRCTAWLADPFGSAENSWKNAAGGTNHPFSEKSGGPKRWMRWLDEALKSLRHHGFGKTWSRTVAVLQEQRRQRLREKVAVNDGMPPMGLHPYIQSQLQALWALSDGFQHLERKRHKVQAQRKVPDTVLLERFPPWVVTTYPGDEKLFAASWFRDQLPKEIPFRYGTLEDVHGDTAVERHHSHV